MKRFRVLFFGIILLLSVLVLAGCNDSTTAQQVSAGGVVGNMAPDFTLTDMQGQQVSLSQLRGKVVLLNFWATWCPPCREEMPSMEQLHREFGSKGLVILAVNVEKNGRQVVEQFLQRTPYSFPILIDDKNVAQNTYGVFRFPESFLIDRNGVITEKIIGGRDWLSRSMVDRIKFMLNG